MAEARTKDTAAAQMLDQASERGISTAFTRAQEIKPCPIGSTGVCCRICAMGPCRLVGKTTRGVCGATLGTVVARNFSRMVAAGTAAHSDHGRDMVMTLLAAARGESGGFRIRDEAKLRSVAGYLDIDTKGKDTNAIAEQVALALLEDFGRQMGELRYLARAPQKRQQLWKDLGIAPRGIDREVVEAMHRTHAGVDQEAGSILKHTMRMSLADGWGGSMIGTDVSDILFGTPGPVISAANLGVLSENEVNIVIHGHEPTLSEMVAIASQEPELIAYAKEKGAQGINLSGICCTANEVLMRHGVKAAGNFLHQELAILTGAVDAMLVDVQCIMEGLANVADSFHTLLITTSPKAHIRGAEHVEFDEHHAYDIAKRIVRMAIDNYPNRGETHIPKEKEGLVAGFSHEYLNYMQGGTYRASFRPLNDAIAQGRIRGIAGVVGCNNACVPQDVGITKVVEALIANDVLVASTGCAAIGSAKYGLLSPEAWSKVGNNLREVCEAIGIPPVLHLGSCVDNSRILTVLTQMASEGGLGQDISDIPGVGICPEYMSEKSIAIGTYFVASGVNVLFGVKSPVSGSDEVVDIMTREWPEMVGGSLEFEPDIDALIDKALAHIDAKRAALGLEEYRPNRYGVSGDRALEEWLSLPAGQRSPYSRKPVVDQG
ncbi:MAG: anaerobic carbon-monoxide dehydrogenase catalytic subunit [Anaerolineae bacterium]